MIKKITLARLSAAALALGIVFPASLGAEERAAPEPASVLSTPSPVVADDWMIVTAHPLATAAGERVLARGGSAVDAAITAQMVLNLVEPQSSGIGGGAFLVYYDSDSGAVTTLDGRETAPASVDEDLFLDDDGEPLGFWDAVIGGRSVGVPGVLRMLERAHALHGRRPWAELFEPAIDLAENGFEVSARMALSIAEARDLDRFEAARAYFFDSDGAPLAAGTRLRNPAFAATLREIAEYGADAFYRGDIAADIAAAVSNADPPGHVSQSDLAGYRAHERPPVCMPYRDWTACGMGPPSSGGVAVAQILGLLEHVDMASVAGSVDEVHRFAEAARLAFADRDVYLADSDFVPVPLAGLIDSAYLTARAQGIDLDRATPDPGPGNPPWRDATVPAPDRSRTDSGTTHLSVIDADGNAVSMTSSIEMGFGSRIFVRGFLLNNQLTDFSFVPERDGRPVANRVSAGKRPRSSMAPTVVLDHAGRPVLIIGSPGGSRIINYVARAVVAVLDGGMNIHEAVNAPHFGNRDGPTELEVQRFPETLLETLAERGHEVIEAEMTSGLNAIALDDGRLHAGIDARREGAAAGSR